MKPTRRWFLALTGACIASAAEDKDVFVLEVEGMV
jgi:hypothetical protein